ncbi:glycosyltransferase family 2 protein [Nocardia sp. NPDC051052]|uniref:glycosyltransferase family 2 protein n=1 Tax=Nocardia sp. NPDC051052 TaxID=3364322 RepID=UPI00378D8583
MRVEVVTAVHAEYARYLPAAWRSLRAQTHPDWHWLVQVDGDAAAVRAMLIDCGAADDPRTRLAFNGTREGPAITRNVALGRAAAALIQNLDADDELEPTALAVLSAALHRHPSAGFAVGTASDLLNSGELVDVPISFAPGLLPRGALIDAWTTDRLPVHPAGVMWHRDLLLATGGWAAMRGMEDTGLLMSASALSPGAIVDSRTLRYRRHRNQRSTQTSLFTGGGDQISLIRQRAATLRAGPGWFGLLPQR